ncbi:hypothetical protein K474DRAFT_1661889 [Panus rudis PR-1116 ss-1]|nr:hypothetical protein K474DRAFT_1661889 [Panus rudis PR-1116 ss-1]
MEESGQRETVAVVLLLDASIALGSVVQNALKQCVEPFLHRLHELHPSALPRIALVCYSSSATRPSPILHRHFFTEPKAILSEFRERPSQFGVGKCSTGGDRGLAALEGIVAALEMIDTLLDNSNPQNINIHPFLLHFAAIPPDSAERPLHNVLPRFDSASWDTLPQEMKRKSISYTVVLLQPIPRLEQFHSAVASGNVQSAWFQVHDAHKVLISGIRQAVKRPAELSPKAKRQKVTSPKQGTSVVHSPKQSNPVVNTPKIPAAAPQPPAAPPQPPIATASSSNGPAPVVSHAANPSVTFEQAQFIFQQCQRLEIASKQRAHQIMLAKASGDIEKAGKLEDEMTKIKGESMRLKQIISKYLENTVDKDRFIRWAKQSFIQRSMQHVPHAQNASAPVPSGSVAQPPPTSQQPPSSGPHILDQQVAGPSTQPQMPPSNPAPPSAMLAPHLTPEIAAQWDKLNQQRNRTPLMTNATIPPAPPPAYGNPLPQGQPGDPQPVIWTGALTWSGVEPISNMKQDIRIRVRFSAGVTTQIPDTSNWPSEMHITPAAQYPPVSVLTDWLVRIPVVLLKVGALDNADPGWGMLVKLLIEKRRHALIAWKEGNDSKARILLFVARPHPPALLAAYFPSGMPEMPKETIAGVSLHQFSPPDAAIIWRLPADGVRMVEAEPMAVRFNKLGEILKVAKARTQSNSGSGSGAPTGMSMMPGAGQGPGPGPNPMLMNAVPPAHVKPNAAGANAMRNMSPTQLARLRSMAAHHRTPSGGGGLPPNMTPEMLQSFMQRPPQDPSSQDPSSQGRMGPG